MKRWSALSWLLTVIGLTLLSWAFIILAVIGADHLIVDHKLFGMLK
jgi:hypothetical protein